MMFVRYHSSNDLATTPASGSPIAIICPSHDQVPRFTHNSRVVPSGGSFVLRQVGG